MKNQSNIKQKDLDAVDSPSLTDEMLSQMQPMSKVHPLISRRVRGRQKSPTKVPVSIRLSSDVLEYFKKQGKGWQTSIDAVLNTYIKNH